MSKKKNILSRILCILTSVCLIIALSVAVTITVADNLAFRGCAQNGDMLEAIAFIIECEDDCEIVEACCDCEKGKAIMIANPNNGGEPYLIYLTVKETAPFTYGWVVVGE